MAEVKVAEESVLTDDFLRQLINVGEVDILVGVPTHNNAKTIGAIAETIQAGILTFFPRERAAIINVDGGSRDGTPELVASAAIDDARPNAKMYTLRTFHSISTQYASSPARGTALHTIMAAAELLRAKACAVISPESTQITNDWLATLLRPVYTEDFDLVLPTYSRHRFDGILLTNLLYPMTRALYGLKIREPFALDYAFSGRLGSQFLTQNAWHEETAQAGSETQLTLAAIAGEYRICQSFLGTKERAERHSADLVPAMRQTVGALFSSLETNFSLWSARTGSQTIPTTGEERKFSLEPLRINRKRLREMFSTGVAELESIFQSILSPATLAELQSIARTEDVPFRYSAELWVKTIYEFAAAYHKSVISRDHIIQALAPLFRGRALTFLAENINGSADDVENNIENLCLEFERTKPYLLEIWKQ
jgi:glycosyltransferase involved in cell wall biosynthesis